VLSPFVPPSQVLVDYYKKLRNQVIVSGKEDFRIMNEAEAEQFLFAHVKKIGVRTAFRSNPLDKDYKLKDRDWN
jgi:hypothetical protein